MFHFFEKFRAGITESKKTIQSMLSYVFQSKKIGQELVDEIEHLLYRADFGVDATNDVMKEIRNAYKRNSDIRASDCVQICTSVLSNIMKHAEQEVVFDKNIPTVISLLGGNGSGKTTTAAKLASYFHNRSKSVIVGACDTYRAAANQQIKHWSARVGFDLVESMHGADPSSVAYDACSAAVARKKDVLILDTAGRMHNKYGLVSELKKIHTVAAKINPLFPQYRWLVVDASLGSNSITAAKMYHEEIGINGIVITKLDGTSKGGAAVGIYRQLHIPIYFIGTGEQCEDIIPFKENEYIHALLENDE